MLRLAGGIEVSWCVVGTRVLGRVTFRTYVCDLPPLGRFQDNIAPQPGIKTETAETESEMKKPELKKLNCISVSGIQKPQFNLVFISV
jgi:hypothetical protein